MNSPTTTTVAQSCGAPRWPARRLGWLAGAWLLLGLPTGGAAQQLLDFQYTDSLTQALLSQHRYRALDSVGRAAQALGAGYPALGRRLGAGALAAGHPAAALRYYGAALRENPLDPAARVGLAQAYQALNQPGPAALLAGALPDSLRQTLRLPAPRALATLEVEASLLPTSEQRRGTASYGRVGVGSRLSPRLLLGQEVSYYRQQVEQPQPGSSGNPGGSGSPPPTSELHLVSQGQYHALLTGQLGPRWQAKAGYDFITHDLGINHLGYLALAYARPVWSAQVGYYAGILSDTTRTQADLRLTVYPLGSLRFYAFGRGSVVASAGRRYPNGLLGAGGQLRPWLWVEAWAGGGTVPVLADLDGTYVYNLVDPLRRRAAASLLILASRRLTGRLTYGTEQRQLAVGGFDYVLHSCTSTLTWTW